MIQIAYMLHYNSSIHSQGPIHNKMCSRCAQNVLQNTGSPSSGYTPASIDQRTPARHWDNTSSILESWLHPMMEGGEGNSELHCTKVESRLILLPSCIYMIKEGGGVLCIFWRSLVQNVGYNFSLGCPTFILYI